MFSSTPRRLNQIKSRIRKATPSRQRGLRPRLEVLEDRTLLSVQILFDYSQDANGFFTENPQAKAILQDAASDLTSRLSTSTPLLAIESSGDNSWTAKSFNPANPAQTLSIPNLIVPQDSLVIYVGGADLPAGGELGLGGPGGYTDSGDAAFLATVQSRGQTGFAPWGGSISFDISPSENWYFGTSPSVAAGQADFFSVATHELGHILGIGTSSQWQNLIQSGSFIGSHGATNTTLALNNVTTSMNGYEYEAVFTNTSGSKTTSAATLTVHAPTPLPPPPPPSSPPALPPAPPTLNVPPLLAVFDSLFGGVETVNANGTETVTDSFFGFPLLVSTFDDSGELVSVDLFGFFDITLLFVLS